MASFSSVCFKQDGVLGSASLDILISRKTSFHPFQKPFIGFFPSKKTQVPELISHLLCKKAALFPLISCAKNDEHNDKDQHTQRISVERAPYYSYMDSTSGQLEPASGARASIPSQEYWPEGTAGRVRAARAPEPMGNSEGEPSYGKNPGSRRKNSKNKAAASRSSAQMTGSSDFPISNTSKNMPEIGDISSEDLKDESSEYVIYQTELVEEKLSEYELDKKIGRPHAFVDPEKIKPIENSLSSEELWWNWRKPEKEQWSRWQRRRPDVDTVFAKAMEESGQIKLYGDHPTLTETALARARRHIFKEERLQAEQRRLEEIGPMAYYSEWVKAWKKDTSREAVQKHFEKTGEDENIQLIKMFQHQTASEYRIMMGTDVRIKRDPLAMRMRQDQIKEIWGGDPVYPTVNYIQDPNEIIDYRGPDFHEPTPNILSYLMEHGKVISRDELQKLLAREKTEELEQISDMDEAMARAVDIGENDEDEDDDENTSEEEDGGKVTRNWSVYKSTPQPGSSKVKKKEEPMSLEEAIEDSENITDFLMDFDEDE